MQEILEFLLSNGVKPWFLTCFAIKSLGKPCTGSQDAKAGNLNPGVEFSGKNWSTQKRYELMKAELANVGIQPTKLELVYIIYIRVCNMCTKQKKCMQSVKTWNVNVSPAYWLLARDLIMSFTSSWKKNRLPDAKSLKGLGTPLLPKSGVILHPKTLDDLVLRCNGSICSFPQEKPTCFCEPLFGNNSTLADFELAWQWLDHATNCQNDPPQPDNNRGNPWIPWP